MAQTFNLTIHCGTPAFVHTGRGHKPRHEVARILRSLALVVERGEIQEGIVKDDDHKTVGSWTLRDDDGET